MIHFASLFQQWHSEVSRTVEWKWLNDILPSFHSRLEYLLLDEMNAKSLKSQLQIHHIPLHMISQ